MKTPSSSLFKLIKALHPNEKSYFIRNASTYGNKKSILLYDAIETQREYDELKLKQQFADDNYLGKGLGVAKLSLQSALLKSLRSYNDTSTLDFTLMNLLKDIDILYNKGLYDMCSALISKMKKLAIKYEKWSWQCEAIQYERRLMSSKGYTLSAHNYLNKLRKEQQDALRKLENLYEFRALYDSINFLLKSEGIRNKDFKELNSLFDHTLLRSKKNVLSKRAQIFYNEIKIYYYMYFRTSPKLTYNRTRNNVLFTKQLLRTMETEESIRAHLSALKLHVHSSIFLKKWNEGLSLCQQMKGFIKSSHSFNSIKMAFVDASVNELEINSKLGNFTQTVALTNDAEKVMKDYAPYFNNGYYIVTYFNMAYGFFGAGNYREALKWHNKLLNDTDLTIRPDVHCLARIMNLLIHYELGNQELLEYIIRSTYRFLYKRKRLYKFEDTLLHFIRKDLLSINCRRELLLAFKVLHERLKEIIKDPFEEKAIEEFDIISWLESKIENRPFADIVQEKEHF